MKESRVTAAALVGFLAVFANPSPAAQLGGLLSKAQRARDQVKSMTMSDEDEQQIGKGVGDRVRVRYGVVQDPAVHKYVSLVGLALAKSSIRPDLPWTFVVLDTDGVNAFAAPGGYVHITRGALALIGDESELAGVLAHEITHVTEKHTISAIQKNKLVATGASETLKGNATLLNAFVDKAFDMVYAGFGRGEELESDRKGIELANAVGYAPSGLGGFLARLADRNRASIGKQGLFASHPDMKERLDKLSKQVSGDTLASTAALADRYHKNVTYEPKELTEIAAVAPGSAGLTGGGKADAKDAGKDGKDSKDRDADKKEDPPKKTGAFGIAGLAKPAAGGSEKRSAEVTASGGSRGVDAERGAGGGGNPNRVAVTVSAADIAAFKKEGGLR